MTSAGKDRQLSLFGSNDSNEEPSDADELALAELEVEELASVAFEPEEIDAEDLDASFEVPDNAADYEEDNADSEQAPAAYAAPSSSAQAQPYGAPVAPALNQQAPTQSSYTPQAQSSSTQASGQTPFQSNPL